MNTRVMCVGFHRLKVSWTHNIESGDTLTAGGDTFLLVVGMIRRRTANTLEVYVTVTIYNTYTTQCSNISL